MDSTGWEYGPVAGFYEYANGRLGSVKFGLFLDQMNDCQLLMKTLLNGFSVAQRT
jgi:hypothetical protein